MSPIRCEIVTQERLVFAEDVDMLTAPGVEGELGVLPHHAPLLTALAPGELRIKRGGVEEYFAIGGGFMEIQPDKITILADTAEHSAEIDASRAEQARTRAEQLLRERPPDASTAAALEASLRRAQARLRVARRHRPGRRDYEG
jgi:F-type H+-transporting ATPase subunit epsilon